jgi:hypothetical protein
MKSSSTDDTNAAKYIKTDEFFNDNSRSSDEGKVSLIEGIRYFN